MSNNKIIDDESIIKMKEDIKNIKVILLVAYLILATVCTVITILSITSKNESVSINKNESVSIKECPLCGSESSYYSSNNKYGVSGTIQCSNDECGLELSNYGDNQKEIELSLIEHWNNRKSDK